VAIYFRIDPTKYSADVELIPVKLNVEAYTGFLDGKSSGDWVYLKASCRGVQLMTEVVLFDVTAGIAELWVNMLSLSSTEPEFIKLEYAATDQTTRSLADLSDDFSGEVGSPANPLLWTRRNHYSDLQYLRSATVHEHISGGYKMGVFPAASGTWEMEQIYGNVVLVDEFDVELEVDLTYAGSTFQCQLWLVRSFYDSVRWGHNAQTTLFGQAKRDGYTAAVQTVSGITANLSSIKYRITRDASDNIDYYYDVGAGWVHAWQDAVSQPNGLVPLVTFWDNGGAGTEYAIIKNFTINSCANRSSGLTTHRSSSYNAGGVWGVDCLVACHMSDDPSGAVYNSSPNRVHFSSSGSMTSGDVVDDDTFFGKSIDFDGGNDFIRANELALILDSMNSYSIGLTALWSGRRDGTSADAAWQFTGASSGGLFKAVHSGDNGYFGVSASISSSETTYSLGISGKGANERLIMALNYKYPAATCDVYSDGAFVRQQTGCNKALWAAAARFSIAQEYDSFSTPSDLWDGTINEVIMYYNTKTAEWIEAMSANLAGELATIVDLPKIEVRINSDNIDAAITDFPHKVYLQGDPSFVDILGSDDWHYLHATDDEDNELYVEVEHWDPDNGEAILHIIYPTVSASVDTSAILQMTDVDNYTAGYISEVGGAAAKAVWPDHHIVCHMNQDPSGGADSIVSSSDGARDGTSVGTMLTEDLVDCELGGQAIEFDGSDDGIIFGDIQDLWVNNKTFSIMFKKNTPGDAATHSLFGKGNYTSTLEGYHAFLLNGVDGYVRCRGGNIGDKAAQNLVPAIVADDDWHVLVLRHDYTGEEKISGFIDGVNAWSGGGAGASYATLTGFASNDCAEELSIAHILSGSTGYNFADITVKEFRVYDDAASDAFIKAEYLSLVNKLSVQTFVSKDFQVDVDVVDEALTNFPAKVVLDFDFMQGLNADDWKYLHIADYDTGEEFYIEKEMWAPNELGIVHALIPAISATEQTAFTAKVTSESNYLRRVLEAEVFDDFSGTDDDPPYEGKWLVNNGTPTIQSNKLRFDADSGNALERIFSKFILSGNFDVQITVLMDDDPETSRWAVSFGLADEVTSKPYRLFRGYRTDLTNFNHFSVYEDTAYTEDVAATSLSFDLRIVRIGNFHFYYYDIGAGWVLLDSNDISAANDMKLEIYFQTADGFPTIGGVVTDFQINSCDGITGFIGEAGELQAQNVWRGMFGVWNLAQDAGSGNLLDSTPNENDGTPNGLVAADLVETDYGYAQQFSGATVERISFGNLGLDGGDDYTVMMFVIPESVSGTQLFISSRTTSQSDSLQTLFQLYTSGVTQTQIGSTIRDADGDSSSPLAAVGTLALNTPVLMTTRKVTSLSLFVNDSLEDVESLAGISTSILSEVVSVGHYWDDTTNTWLTSIVPTAKIIQVIILTEGMSDAWIKAYYNSIIGTLFEDYVAPVVVEGGFGGLVINGQVVETTGAKICLNGQWLDATAAVVLKAEDWKTIG
jgi:hypothetical protein